MAQNSRTPHLTQLFGEFPSSDFLTAGVVDHQRSPFYENWTDGAKESHATEALGSLRLHVVAEQNVLIAKVELASDDNWMGPALFSAAVGWREAALLYVTSRGSFYEGNHTLLGFFAAVKAAICIHERAFAKPILLLPFGRA